jgi:predicted peroxiredoxin
MNGIKMKKILQIVLGSIFAINAYAADLFVTINSDKPMTQGAALVLATQSRAQENNVRVLLCDAAADIAIKGQVLPKLKPKDVTTQQMLMGLMRAGGKIEVCALYLPNTGRQASELIPGVSVANPADIARYISVSDVQILSF